MAENIRSLFSPLIVNELNIREDCAKYWNKTGKLIQKITKRKYPTDDLIPALEHIFLFISLISNISGLE